MDGRPELALDLGSACPHTADMGATLEDAVRRALQAAPASLRTLAERAGVSERLLRMIRDGERTATPRVVDALAEALEALSRDHAAAASILREQETHERTEIQ